MTYCPVILSGAQRSRRSGVQLAASQASSSATDAGGKDASATLSMTKRRTSVTSVSNLHPAASWAAGAEQSYVARASSVQSTQAKADSHIGHCPSADHSE